MFLINYVSAVCSVLCPGSGRPPDREMALAQRVLLTWVFTLVFLIMLVLKLDGKVEIFCLSHTKNGTFWLIAPFQIH